jgi:hypothetical protein
LLQHLLQRLRQRLLLQRAQGHRLAHLRLSVPLPPDLEAARVSRGVARGLIAIAIAIALAISLACVVEDLRFEGRRCSASEPCGGGTTCDPALGRCVRASSDGPRELSLVDLAPSGDRPDLLPVLDRAQSLEPRKDVRPPDRPKDNTQALDHSPCGTQCTDPSTICCQTTVGGKFICAPNPTLCICNPSTGDPCTSAVPVCCASSLSDPRCQANSSGCLCNPSTGNPCFGAYGKCCAGDGGVSRCAATCAGTGSGKG